MTKYIHASTSHGSIGMDGDRISAHCTVLLNKLVERGGRRCISGLEINFYVEHTCEAADLKDDFAAFEEKVRTRGKALADAYIAGKADGVAA